MNHKQEDILPNGTLLQNGKYKIVRFIKNGGFGCTYEGEQSLMGARIAIKEFFPSSFCNREEDNTVTVGTKSKIKDFLKQKSSFIKEATILFKMQHPNIVRVTDVFEENGTAYYAMDFIEGDSLDNILKHKGKLSEKEALDYIIQVCVALKFVHSQNRLHLDIKPGNIMVTNSGKVILIDFGTSKYYNPETREQTSTFIPIATKGYAPIEQMDGSFKTFNPAADIYAIGATLYKLLTGITPPSASELILNYDILAPLPNNISKPVRNAIKAAMEGRKEERPQSIEEFEKILFDKTKFNSFIYDEETELEEVEKISNSHRINDPNNKGFAQFNSKTKDFPLTSNSPIHHSKEQKEGEDSKQVQRSIIEKIKSSKTFLYIGGISAVSLFIICLFAFGRSNEAENVHIEDLSYVSNENSESDIGLKGKEKPLEGTNNGHEYVDLGLPSGLKWATCNIGASAPEQYGNYYAWGEIKPKSEYSEGNSETYNKDNQWLRANGYIGSNGNLTPSHDAARQTWGSSWRIPTKKEIEELINNTSTEWTERNGVKGRLVKSNKNGNTIFLPAAGSRYGSSLDKAGVDGYYWGSTPDESGSQGAYDLYFDSSYFIWFWLNRSYGRTVRPVSE